MYLLFRIAKVLHVQLGVDCRYYTKYKSEAFQPATLTFHTQDEIEVGNYPFMNAYEIETNSFLCHDVARESRDIRGK